MEYSPVLSICFLAYNHERYIQEAIDSILSQKTDFFFEIVIGEDCSSDNTRDICEKYEEKYPDKINLLPSTNNLGMIPNFVRVLNNCKGKYIAFLEGDDYWIDSSKLQNQVDFLEKNTNCGLVFTNYQIIDDSGQLILNQKYNAAPPSGFILTDLIKGGFPYPLTVCFRKSLLRTPEIFLMPHYKMGDYPLWLELGRVTEFHYLDAITACYRRHETSITSNANSIQTKIDFRESWIEIQNNFLSRYSITDDLTIQNATKAISKKYFECFGLAMQKQDYQQTNKYWMAIKNLNVQIPNKIKIQYALTKLGLVGQLMFKTYKFVTD